MSSPEKTHEPISERDLEIDPKQPVVSSGLWALAICKNNGTLLLVKDKNGIKHPVLDSSPFMTKELANIFKNSKALTGLQKNRIQPIQLTSNTVYYFRIKPIAGEKTRKYKYEEFIYLNTEGLIKPQHLSHPLPHHH